MSDGPIEGSELLVERHGDGVAVVTLHRPHARNALNRALRRDLYRALRDLDQDEAIAAIVLTGTDPAFCAGLDLKELANDSGDLDDAVVADDGRRAGPVPHLATPLIGAINGVAITGGLELALACDFLVASEHARFADTHARVGIMPGWGLTVRLPEAIGLRRAREMSTTGNFIDAAQALEWGLVNHVVSADELLDTAIGLAGDIAANDQAAVSELLSIYRDGASLHQEAALRLEVERSRAWLRDRTPDDLDARRQAVTERGRGQI